MLNLTKKTKDDLEQTCAYVLDCFHVRYTTYHVKGMLDNHVEYPSLLSLMDVLEGYGIASMAIRKNEYQYSDFETPFICSIQKSDWSSPSFTVVTSVDEMTVEYLDPKTNSLTNVAYSEFEKMDKEIVLLLDGEGKKDEADFRMNRREERTAQLIRQLPLIIAVMAILAAGVYLGVNFPWGMSWIPFVFLLTGSVGLASSILLLWHEVDAHNPFLKEVCGGTGRKLNCEAVLKSKGAHFLGISWSMWGFAYFASFFLSQILFPGYWSYVSVWSFISLATAPYIFYSLYYQWRIVQQWCPLCLSVQAVLVVNTGVAMGMVLGNTPPLIDWYAIMVVVLLSVILLIGAYYTVPILKQAKDSRKFEKKWKKLRYNPQIFETLLQKSNPIMVSPEGLGIVVGNPSARNEIIKVCNPYCGPCSKAHPELEHIITHNDDVKLRIIFTASGEENDIKTPPVSHLLAIAEKHGSVAVHGALDDWYMAESKDYDTFAGKYPMNGELKQQKDKILAMRDWCNAMKVRATPTIFINGYEMPDSYRINELKNFF